MNDAKRKSKQIMTDSTQATDQRIAKTTSSLLLTEVITMPHMIQHSIQHSRVEAYLFFFYFANFIDW